MNLRLDRKCKQAEVVITLEPKGKEMGSMKDAFSFVVSIIPGLQQTPTPTHSFERNVETLHSSRKGKSTVRETYSYPGLGYQKKQMPFCNGEDKGFTLLREQANVWLVCATRSRLINCFYRKELEET